jgi:hypothetical protein
MGSSNAMKGRIPLNTLNRLTIGSLVGSISYLQLSFLEAAKAQNPSNAIIMIRACDMVLMRG